MNYKSNPELELADKFINNTGEHIFLTGKAGTGKTTFLRNLQLNINKKLIITAPTGVAAMNAGGVTIHSFFQIPFGEGINNIDLSTSVKNMRKEKIKIIRGIDILVIDEISMVRADLLDAVDAVLRRYRNRYKAFGGVQLLMIGDLRQLAPVIKNEEIEALSRTYSTPYFFSSKVWSQASFVTIELKEIFRQSDHRFINLLNSIRDSKNVASTLTELNERFNPGFKPRDDEGYITLTTHNVQSDKINADNMRMIKDKSYFFKAQIDGVFPESIYPVGAKLELKKGAQVMFIRNDSDPMKRYFNGKIGQIVNIADDKIEVKCKDDGTLINVTPETWHNSEYSIDPQSNNIVETVKGSFSQVPLKLAWAITVHKSQGLTFEKVIIDANRAFAHGQLYVALSRCRSLEGIVLSSLIGAGAVVDDGNISSFCEEIERNTPSEQMLILARKRYFVDLVNEMFLYDDMVRQLKYIYSLINQHYSKQYRELLSACSEAADLSIHELQEVAFRFKNQLNTLQNSCEDVENDEHVNRRIESAIGYFKEKHRSIFMHFLEMSNSEFDNRVVAKSYNDTLSKFKDGYELKKCVFDKLSGERFSILGYLKVKSDFELALKSPDKVAKAKKKIDAKSPVPTDVKYPELFEKLRSWRASMANEKELPAYVIMSQNAIKGVASLLPMTRAELLKISGVGDKMVERYGDEILTMVIDFCAENKIKVII